MRTKKRNTALAFCAFAWIGLLSLEIVRAKEVDPFPVSSEREESVESQAGMEDEEFERFDGFESLDEGEVEPLEGAGSSESGARYRGLKLALVALFFAVLAGVFLRTKPTRAVRTAFLLGSLIVLGFWNGGCPCPLSSFQNLVLWHQNADVELHSGVWFVGLIPITYGFGRVWCGWVCHLGAFQEFLHKPNRFAFLRGERARETMRILRYVFFAALLVQLVWTKDNQFIHIDPFKAAFNLRSSI